MQTLPPAAYPRRILLAVTGLSPQIVTETLHALAVGGEQPFVPTEIHLITTAEGAERPTRRDCERTGEPNPQRSSASEVQVNVATELRLPSSPTGVP